MYEERERNVEAARMAAAEKVDEARSAKEWEQEMRVLEDSAVKIGKWVSDACEEEIAETEAASDSCEEVISETEAASDSCEEGIFETEATEGMGACTFGFPRPLLPGLSAEKERQARLIFECFDSDGSGSINLNEFAALIVKDRKVADFLGFGNRIRRSSKVVHRRSTVCIDSTFRDMCGMGTTELTWPAFRDFIARRSTPEVFCDRDEEPAPKNKTLLPENAYARLIFDTIDADSSGKISCTELAAACIKRPCIAKFVLGRNGNNVSRRPNADKLFKQMDLDGDLSISFEEFAQFIALQTVPASGDESTC